MIIIIKKECGYKRSSSVSSDRDETFVLKKTSLLDEINFSLELRAFKFL